MTEPTPPRSRFRPTLTRVILWVVVGGFGAYLVITGIVGILTKAR